MKFEKVFKTILLPTAMISMISSCGDDFDFESHYPGEGIKKEYSDVWEKQFGKIDPNQDWCMAESSSVTVTVAAESHIKVYADNEHYIHLSAIMKE